MTLADPTGLNLRDGLDLSGMDYPLLWLLYVGIGGTVPSSELAEQIERDGHPGTELDAYDHNLIAQAINEHFLDRDQDHVVGYRDDPDNGPQGSDTASD